MRLLPTMFRWAAISALAALFFAGPLYAEKDDAPTPKEWGVYVKTGSKLVRILPNVVFDARIPYLESNHPARFPLKDIEYFVMYGKREMQYLTLNNLVFINETLGKPRFMFGREVETEVKEQGRLPLYRPAEGALRKGLLRALDQRFRMGLHCGIEGRAPVV